MPLPVAPRLDARQDQRAMRDIGIVAGILDDTRRRAVAGLELAMRQREARPLALRAARFSTGIGKRPGHQRLERARAPRRRRRRRWSSPGASADFG